MAQYLLLYCILCFVFKISVMLYKNFKMKFLSTNSNSNSHSEHYISIYAKCNKHTSIAPFNACFFSVVVVLRFCIVLLFFFFSCHFLVKFQSNLYQEHKIDFEQSERLDLILFNNDNKNNNNFSLSNKTE